VQKKRKIIVIFAIVILIPILLWLIFVFRYHPSITVKSMESQIRNEIQKGATHVDVVRFLNDHKIEHSKYLRDNKKIYAIVRDVCWGIFIECSIEMVFEFDSRGVMISSSVKEGYTGL